MKISITEKLNVALIKGGKAYDEWAKVNHLPGYLALIMYELLIRKRITQKQLVDLTDLPKQSINKGIRILQGQNCLTTSVDSTDKRQKFCQLTPAGEKYARAKMQPLFDLEEKTVQIMGNDQMQQLVALSEQWNQIFWKLLKDQERNSKSDERI